MFHAAQRQLLRPLNNQKKNESFRNIENLHKNFLACWVNTGHISMGIKTYFSER